MSKQIFLSVRVEGWNSLGKNLGNHSIGTMFDGIEGAKELAREYWKEADGYWKSKQLTIADAEGNRLWMYKDGVIYEADEHGRLQPVLK